MKNKNIVLLTLLLSASLSTPVIFADNARKDDFDARIEQMNKQFEADSVTVLRSFTTVQDDI